MFCVLHIVLYCFQNNSVYDSTQFDNGATPVNPLYAASLQSPDSITGYSIDSAQSLEVGAVGQGYQQNYTVQQHWNICMAFRFWSFFFFNTSSNWKGMMPDLHNALTTDTVFLVAAIKQIRCVVTVRSDMNRRDKGTVFLQILWRKLLGIKTAYLFTKFI